MTIYALLLYDHKYQLSYSNYKLDDFSFIYRFKIKSVIESFSATLIKKCEPNTCYKIMETFDDKQMVIYGSTYDNIFRIVIVDQNYPQHVAFKLLSALAKTSNDMDKLFDLYQDPTKADKIEQLKNELDETKIVLMNSINDLLERGSNIDDLLDKATALSDTSFIFADKTKDMNRCCIIF